MAGNYKDAITLLSAVDKDKNSALYSACNKALKGFYGEIVSLLELESFDVPSGTDSIKQEAFKNCTTLKRVSIPSSVVVIGYKAFYGCSALETIAIPEGIETIEDSAFGKCVSLTEVSLPGSIIKMGDKVMYGCNAIMKLSTPLNEKFAIYELFFNTDSMYPQNKNVPASLATIEITAGTVIPANFFSYLPSTVTQISFAEDICEVGAYAYAHSDLSIIIQPTVKIIRAGAFMDMPTVDRVDVPEGVEIIGDKAFAQTYFKSIYLPSTLKSLGDSCFEGKNYMNNEYLTQLNFFGTRVQWESATTSKWNKGLGSTFRVTRLVCLDSTYIFSFTESSWSN